MNKTTVASIIDASFQVTPRFLSLGKFGLRSIAISEVLFRFLLKYYFDSIEKFPSTVNFYKKRYDLRLIMLLVIIILPEGSK